MFKKVLFFLVISCCCCLFWCKPTRDFDDFEKYDIVKDERQTGLNSPGANFHLKFDGLLVAFKEPTRQQLDVVGGAGGHLYDQVIESIFGGLFQAPIPPAWVTENYTNSETSSTASPLQTNIDNITTTDKFTIIDIDTTTIVSSEDTSTSSASPKINIEAVLNTDGKEPQKLDDLLSAVAEQSTKDADETSLLSRMHKPDGDVPPPAANKEYLQSVDTGNQEQSTESEKKSETATGSGTSPNVANKDSGAPLEADILTT